MKTLKVLVGCEYSGTVRDAFSSLGHNATSCDLLPSETPGKHYQGEIRDILDDDWDLGIFFPPCTDLCVSGAKHFAAKRADGRQQASIEFFMLFANCKLPHFAIENPIGIMSRLWRKPDQIVQPFWFGEPHTKSTCLWIHNLPELKPTNMVEKGERHVTKSGRSLPKWYNLPPSEDRWKIRSTTFSGLANAMASQWSSFLSSSPATCPSASAAMNRGVQLALPIITNATA